ncbi:MAG: FmdE family protein [Candidatus Hatepunaea meridiana]|nr:FmdE family protein [Candidatus Hatepunaea meridiana]
MKRNTIAFILVLGFTLTTGIVGIQAAEHDQWNAFYDKAPTIVISEPDAVMKGSLPEGKDVIHISVTDIAKFNGHICASSASGYMMTHLALKELYPKGIPVRGQIQIAASGMGEPVCIASTIIRVGPHGHDGDDLVIDKSLNTGTPGDIVMIFQHKDTGKSVKTVFHKFNLIPPKTAKKMKQLLHHKIPEGKANQEEKEYARKTVQSFVKTILLDTPKDVIEVVPLKNYKFPKAAGR